MPEIVARSLLKTDTVTIRDVCCAGRHTHKSDEESTRTTHLVFPYRGVLVRHLGREPQLRLARALQLLPQYDDLTSLSLDLGFYSHSHFTTAFAKAYGYSPSKFRRVASHR
jgi:AraC-like DNA-binding protein